MRQYSIIAIIILLITSIAVSQPTREINRTIPLKKDGCLIIDTYKGTINVTTHDEPVIELNVKIEADEFDAQNAEADVKNTEIDIQDSENEVTFHTNYRNMRNDNDDQDFWDWITDSHLSSNSLPLVHYTIKMPRTADLRIKDYKSRTFIDGLKAHLTLDTYKGTAEVTDLNGGVDLETYKGDVRLSFLTLKNESRFKTYKGKISVTLSKETGFELQTDFDRRVHFNSDFEVQKHARDKKHRTFEYTGKINGGGPILEFNSDKGDIRLRAK
jgi:hypothetical protein